MRTGGRPSQLGSSRWAEKAVRPRRHVRDVPRRARTALPYPRARRSSPATSPRWPPNGINARAHLHGAAALAARPRRRARAVGDGRPAVGAARRLPRRRAARGAIDRGAVRAGVRGLRRPSRGALLRGRQRDPGLDRALARPPADRALPRAALPRRRSDEDPDALVTYVNYPRPSTSQLPFLDLVCFNVYLETRRAVRGLPRAAAEPRRRPAAGDRRARASTAAATASEAQAEALELAGARRAFAAAAPGTFVFAWTDEWHRGGDDVDDWDFGLVDRDRAPEAGARGGRRAPSPTRRSRREPAGPRISVVVCTLQRRARRSRECLDGARARSTTPTTR